MAVGVELEPERTEDAVERAVVTVRAEAAVDGLPGAVALRHIAPRGPGAELPKDAVERVSGVAAGAAGRSGGGEQRGDGVPLLVREFVAAQGQVGEKAPKLSPTEFRDKP